jgi:hypothetical protein
LFQGQESRGLAGSAVFEPATPIWLRIEQEKRVVK